MSDWLGKLVHHRCGCPLWAETLDHIGPYVVVSYRDQEGMIVFQCPHCDKSLQLWWESPKEVRQVGRVDGDTGECM